MFVCSYITTPSARGELSGHWFIHSWSIVWCERMSDGRDVGLSVQPFLPFQFQLGPRAGAPFEKRHKQTIIEGHVGVDAKTKLTNYEREEKRLMHYDEDGTRGPRKVKAAAAGLRLNRADCPPFRCSPSTMQAATLKSREKKTLAHQLMTNKFHLLIPPRS